MSAKSDENRANALFTRAKRCRFQLTTWRIQTKVREDNGNAVAQRAWRVFAFCASNFATEEKPRRAMRILGIDPGLRNMGWGVIEVAGSRISHVANGICHSQAGDLAPRLLSLHQQLTDIFATYRPDAAAVEQTFVNKDGVATLKLGQARAIALLVPAQAGVVIGEYAPNAVKKAVVGVGHAAKQQVEHMVKIQLPGVNLAGPDAADALAIAICHAFHAQSHGKLAAALARAGA
jgi:crossover junction endodeoxyribonuclease RuvC